MFNFLRRLFGSERKGLWRDSFYDSDLSETPTKASTPQEGPDWHPIPESIQQCEWRPVKRQGNYVLERYAQEFIDMNSGDRKWMYVGHPVEHCERLRVIEDPIQQTPTDTPSPACFEHGFPVNGP